MSLLEELKGKRESAAAQIDNARWRISCENDEIEKQQAIIADLDRAIAALSVPEVAEVEIPDGFVKWEGGECPVKVGDSLRILWREGVQSGTFVVDDVWATQRAWEPGAHDDDIIAYRVLPIEPAAEAKGEGIDDGEAMRMAHSIMPGSGATFKTDEEIRESVRPHASDCARNNEPAYPAGKCDCTLRLKWTRYSEIAPKSPDELAGYEVQSHYSPEVGEWVYRHYPIAVAAGVDPLAITIASSSQHAEESARAQEAEADFWAKHLVKA